MLRDGTARRAEGAWSSALRLVPKNDSGWRPCGDDRALNGRTIPDRYPVPHTQDYAHHLSGCSIFSKIDLVRAYHQIPDHHHDIQKTSITTPFDLFELPFMSFGLRNAAQTFQRFIDNILKDLDFCFAYLDDILFYSRSHQEHQQHLRTVFTILQNYGILLNPSNFLFRVPENLIPRLQDFIRVIQTPPRTDFKPPILSSSLEHRPTPTFLGNAVFLPKLPAQSRFPSSTTP